ELRADLGAAGIALTHFEFATLIAFEWFARLGIDVGVIEVGLGGRLDATNLVEPAVTAITSIALDHEAWLGHDLAAIAAEKAGIVKPGVPLALGQLPAEAARVVAAHGPRRGPLARAAGRALRAAAGRRRRRPQPRRRCDARRGAAGGGRGPARRAGVRGDGGQGLACDAGAAPRARRGRDRDPRRPPRGGPARAG